MKLQTSKAAGNYNPPMQMSGGADKPCGTDKLQAPPSVYFQGAAAQTIGFTQTLPYQQTPSYEQTSGRHLSPSKKIRKALEYELFIILAIASGANYH